MKKHDEILELLVEFVLGELSEEQAGEVREHLAGCGLCAVEVERLRAVLDCAEQMKGRVDEAVFVSAREKLIERIESSKGETLTGSKIRRRWIMQSKFAKWAVAAVVIVGAFVGLSLLGVSPDGSSIAWASLADHIERFKTVTYSMHMTMKGIPGMPKDKTMEMEQRMTMSSGYGMRTDTITEGKVVSRTYVLFADKSMISIMPEQKKFMRVILTDELSEQMQKNSYDPKECITGIMKVDYIELGRKEIDGVQVEGIETNDPKMMGGMLKNYMIRLWVDVETSLPVRMEIEYNLDDSGMEMKAVVDNYKWDVELDESEFAYTIPADYEEMATVKMPEMNAEAAIEGFKELISVNPDKFPETLNLMDVIMDTGKARHKQQKQERRARKKAVKEAEAAGIDPNTLPEVQREKDRKANKKKMVEEMMGKQMKVQGLCMFYMQLATKDKDPAYYGDRITPADTDAVLMRWLNDEGGYHVIFGDLSIGDFSPEELGEMEAKLPELPLE